MTAEQFTFWLQGFFEISQHILKDGQPLPAEAVEEIKNHLQLVFKKETPRIGIIGEQLSEQILPITRMPYSPPNWPLTTSPFIDTPIQVTCSTSTSVSDAMKELEKYKTFSDHRKMDTTFAC